MGWTFNTQDPDAPTIGPLITGVATALTFLSFVTVCLRTYVRASLIKAFGVDDCIILVTWVCAAGFAIITIVQTKWGLGLEHIDDLPAENVYNFGLLQYMGAPFYITSILGFKLALLFSYIRFVPIGAYRHTIVSVIALCIMFHLSFLLVQLNLCQPARKQWDPAITYGSCIPGVPFYTSMASITIVFDVTVMLLPFPVLLKSRIQTRKKLILLGLFGLGIFITVIQIIRIQTIEQLANYIDSAPLILWSAVENNLGIIVANVPTLAPLVKYYHERTTTGAASSSNNNARGARSDGGYYYGHGHGNTTPTAAAGGSRGTGPGVSGNGVRVYSARGSRGPISSSSIGGKARRASGMWKLASSGKGDRLSSSLSLSLSSSNRGLDTATTLGGGGSSSVRDATEMGSFEGRWMGCSRRGNGSTDSILDSGSADGDNRAVTPGAITKKVEVVITRT